MNTKKDTIRKKNIFFIVYGKINKKYGKWVKKYIKKEREKYKKRD